MLIMGYERVRNMGKIVQGPANAEEIASAVAFYFDEERRQRARTMARQWMEQYPPSRNVEETLAVYYEVAGLKGCDE